MEKKKKTLPKNFEELLKAGDITSLKAVFNGCEISAYDNGFNKKPALSYPKVSAEFIRWLVSQGADIEQRDHYGKTPLYHACVARQPQNVRILIAYGADINVMDSVHNRTPLAEILALCLNANIPQVAEIAEILLNAGAKITPEMADSVRRIGKEYEFYRPGFDKEFLSETDTGLMSLYKMFGVEPAEKRRIHDGVSPITVTTDTWKKQYSELWDYLVPPSGIAGSSQGEAIRIIGKVSYEILDTGGMNWDNDYQKMLNTLLKHFISGTPLPSDELNEAKGLALRIKTRRDGDEKVIDRLCELTVKWVLTNSNPIPLEQPDYNR